MRDYIQLKDRILELCSFLSIVTQSWHRPAHHEISHNKPLMRKVRLILYDNATPPLIEEWHSWMVSRLNYLGWQVSTQSLPS